MGSGSGHEHELYVQWRCGVQPASFPPFPAQCDDPPDFYYSKDFVYNSPECLYVVPEQLVTKGISSVSLVTFFLSKKVQGEPCGTQAALELKASCAGPDGEWTSGVWTEMTNGQCECTRSQSVYPVGVDHMLVSFEHTCAHSPRRCARVARAHQTGRASSI